MIARHFPIYKVYTIKVESNNTLFVGTQIIVTQLQAFEIQTHTKTHIVLVLDHFVSIDFCETSRHATGCIYLKQASNMDLFSATRPNEFA